ncbi:hypothetical protein R8Z50_28665 [Longispora sp. K20-0274]|uniref:hypothetical protein n=1 Tax=Longispora sp. K20-0274 TaxID=3088255 RepID=UPI00399A09CD
MRRLASLLAVTVAGVWLLPPAAVADPTPTPSAAPPAKGTAVCKITDGRLSELSGMVALDTGFAVMNDAPDAGEPNPPKIFFLDNNCKLTSTWVDSAQQARDPEDLAVGKDGTLWIADIGDNHAAEPENKRSTIALWKVPASHQGKAQLFRLKYPDGAHDAEALLLDANDNPIIVTKDGVSGIYVPTGPLAPGNEGTALKKVGDFTATRTGTPGGPIPIISQTLVTGGANSPDRKKVALRTYTDAYEWDVPNGDVVAALTTTKPRITPLPDEPWGESITYSRDGASFLTVSETKEQPEDVKPVIQKYTPAPPAGPATKKTSAAAKNDAESPSSLGINDIAMMIGGVGLIGLLMVIAGVVGIKKARDRHAAEAKKAKPGPGGARPLGAAAVPADPQRGPGGTGARKRSGVYGANRQPAVDDDLFAPDGPDAAPPGRSGSVYGGAARPEPPVPAVYGATPPAEAASGVYGAPRAAADPDSGVYGTGKRPIPDAPGVYGAADPEPGVYGAGKRSAPDAPGVYGAARPEASSGSYGTARSVPEPGSGSHGVARPGPEAPAAYGTPRPAPESNSGSFGTARPGPDPAPAGYGAARPEPMAVEPDPLAFLDAPPRTERGLRSRAGRPTGPGVARTAPASGRARPDADPAARRDPETRGGVPIRPTPAAPRGAAPVPAQPGAPMPPEPATGRAGRAVAPEPAGRAERGRAVVPGPDRAAPVEPVGRSAPDSTVRARPEPEIPPAARSRAEPAAGRSRAGRAESPAAPERVGGVPVRPGPDAGRAGKADNTPPPRTARGVKGRKPKADDDDLSFGFADLKGGDDEPDIGLRSPKGR